MQKRISIKIGSNVLTDNQGKLDMQRIGNLVNQVVQLQKQGFEVLLISSGAVAAGRSLIKPEQKTDEVSQRQLLASIGQIKLMNIYSDLFEKYNLVCSQVLVTKEDFRTRRHYLNIQNCLNTLMHNHVIPVINENDVVSVTELMFTDNDELAGLISTMMDADTLFILSNIDGIFTGNPEDKNSKLIPVIDKNLNNITDFISTKKSNFGRGGMITKYGIARKAASSGITVYIANGKRDNIILDILEDDTKVLNTKFSASTKTFNSQIKKWISYSEGFAKGEVYINKGAKEVLLSNKASSLLLIGVTEIKGSFKTGDIIKIFDEKKNLLGCGKSQYDSDSAIQQIGKKDIKELIHYDYLYLNN